MLELPDVTPRGENATHNQEGDNADADSTVRQTSTAPNNDTQSQEPPGFMEVETRPWAQLSRDCRQRRQSRFGKMLTARGRSLADTRLHFKLKDLQYSPVLLLLAIWHTYGAWVTACIYLTLSANLLLSWYIDWYRQSLEICGNTAEGRCNGKEMLNFPVGPFFAIFLRSWCLVCVVAELVRFCYLMAIDAWRVDAFEAYRQTVCGEPYIQWIEQLCQRSQGGGGTGQNSDNNRTAVGNGNTAADSTSLRGWSSSILTSPRRFIDTSLQLCLYVSLDVMPLAFAIWKYYDTNDPELTFVDLNVSLSLAVSFHSTMYFLAWNVIDVAMKIKAFIAALHEEPGLQPRQYPGENLEAFRWAGSFGDRQLCNLEGARGLSFAQALDGEPPSQCVSFAEPGCDSDDGSSASSLDRRRSASWAQSESSAASSLAELGAGPHVLPPFLLSRVPSIGNSSFQSQQVHRAPSISRLSRVSARRQMRKSLVETARLTIAASRFAESVRAMPGNNGDSEKVAEQLNVCVPFCGWFSGIKAELLPHICCVAVIVVGFLADNLGLILTGVVLLCIIFCRQFISTEEWHQHAWSCPLGWGGGSWQLWALQAWGETYCALSWEAQLACRVTFGTVVLLQGVLFAILYQWAGVAVCAATFGCILLRQLSDGMDRPWGWLLGILEGLLLAFGAAVLNFTTFGIRWALATLLFTSVRQFGLARSNVNGFRLARFITILLNAVLTMVVVVVILTAAYTGMGTDFSFFDGAKETGKFYPFKPFPENGHSSGLACEGRFPLGSETNRKDFGLDQKLTLSDFGLFAALAYETDESMDSALHHYFPGWHVTYKRRASENEGVQKSSDWTTFFEFSDAYNGTTVFAIRGTSSMLDVLDDINIWAPAVIMQLFSRAGPGVSGSTARAVAILSTVIYGRNLQKDYFSDLLDHVKSQKQKWPNRRFYLTGHSLGGGLAKLVASQVGIQAVTFMAPGLQTTSYVVFGEVLDQQLRRNVLTVVPKEDIVSRADSLEGVVINVDCSKGAMACHMIYNTICTILSICGSGRKGPHNQLSLPCGVCDDRPCPDPSSNAGTSPMLSGSAVP